jgi:hypothetical protein
MTVVVAKRKEHEGKAIIRPVVTHAQTQNIAVKARCPVQIRDAQVHMPDPMVRAVPLHVHLVKLVLPDILTHRCSFLYLLRSGVVYAEI